MPCASTIRRGRRWPYSIVTPMSFPTKPSWRRRSSCESRLCWTWGSTRRSCGCSMAPRSLAWQHRATSCSRVASYGRRPIVASRELATSTWCLRQAGVHPGRPCSGALPAGGSSAMSRVPGLTSSATSENSQTLPSHSDAWPCVQGRATERQFPSPTPSSPIRSFQEFGTSHASDAGCPSCVGSSCSQELDATTSHRELPEALLSRPTRRSRLMSLVCS